MILNTLNVYIFGLIQYLHVQFNIYTYSSISTRTVQYDSRIESKENEKVQKYQDLARELRKLWQVKVKVVTVVVGALGTIPKALEKHLKEIGTSVRVEGGTLRHSKDSAKNTRDLRLRDVL